MTADPNMSSENMYIGLSPLTLDDVRTFCNTYIKPFAPYQDEKIYDTLITNLTEYYYHHLYFNVPSGLKQIYEESDFNSLALYDQILNAIGVPTKVIQSLSFSNKLIFLKTLSDFEKYKGTLSFFQKTAEAFSDKISLYELFIDFDEFSGWVLKPVNIYLHDSMELKTTSISYSSVQATIPSLLFTEEQLTELYEEEKLILPIKSNLIMVDTELMTEVSILYDVINAIFLHTYKDNYLEIYFKDTSKTVQLKTLYFLWFYLLTEYYGIPWTAHGVMSLLKFTYSDSTFPAFIGTTPATIDNLSLIIERYDNIKITNTATRDYDNSKNLMDSFYQDISAAFTTISGADAVTAGDMYDELLIMNASLITYIETRITNTSIGKNAEINLIMTEIYSSLVLYATTYSGDGNFTKYVDYFLRSLPQILINPENTQTYTILFNLKPYHVELFNIYNSGIRCHDKFNQVFIDDETGLKFFQNLILASVLSFSDDCFFNYKVASESSFPILSSVNFEITPFVEETMEITEFSPTKFNLVAPDVLTSSDDYSFDSLLLKESALSMRSIIPSFSVTMKENMEIIDNSNYNIKVAMADILVSSIDYVLQFNKDLISNVVCIDVFEII